MAVNLPASSSSFKNAFYKLFFLKAEKNIDMLYFNM